MFSDSVAMLTDSMTCLSEGISDPIYCVKRIIFPLCHGNVDLNNAYVRTSVLRSKLFVKMYTLYYHSSTHY